MAMDCEYCIVWIFKLVSTNRNFVFPFSLHSLARHHTKLDDSRISFETPSKADAPAKFFLLHLLNFVRWFYAFSGSAELGELFFSSTRVGWLVLMNGRWVNRKAKKNERRNSINTRNAKHSISSVKLDDCRSQLWRNRTRKIKIKVQMRFSCFSHVLSPRQTILIKPRVKISHWKSWLFLFLSKVFNLSSLTNVAWIELLCCMLDCDECEVFLAWNRQPCQAEECVCEDEKLKILV